MLQERLGSGGTALHDERRKIDMDISEIRRRNLLLLLERYNQDKDFAAQVKIPTTYLSKLKSPREGDKKMGNAKARQIEEHLKLPFGWMDTLHGDDGALLEPGTAPAKVPLLTVLEAPHARRLVNNHVPLLEHELHATNRPIQRHTFAMVLPDDAMVGPAGTPSLPVGTVVVVEPDEIALPGDYVVIAPRSSKEAAMLRVLDVVKGARVARALNPQFATLRISQFVSICGVAKEAFLALP